MMVVTIAQAMAMGESRTCDIVSSLLAEDNATGLIMLCLAICGLPLHDLFDFVDVRVSAIVLRHHPDHMPNPVDASGLRIQTRGRLTNRA